MVSEKTGIYFTARCEGEKYELQTYKGEYRNLMVLLYDKIYIENFGECKGMGRCGTCVIKVQGLHFNKLERNEASTLNKMGLDATDIRLACQVMVDEHLANVTVTTINDGYYE
ncbi:hypothetical protein BH10BAC3_BH10BAC3_09060 [soil metagenome]